MISTIDCAGEQLLVNILAGDRGRPNIIFLMTPIASVSEDLALSFYRDLAAAHNVFALDLPGLGKSGGGGTTITFPWMKRAFLVLVDYIRTHHGGTIHLYGGTGIGGILAQGLSRDPDCAACLQSCIQYGVANYRDASIMGTNWVYRLAAPGIRFLGHLWPDRRLSFRVPDYHGRNAEREARWYAEVMARYPGSFDMKLGLVASLFWLFFSSRSPLRNPPAVPVLVLASRHDRYYPVDYVERYFDGLGTIRKHLVWFDDSHLCFAWNASALADRIGEWTAEPARQPVPSPP